jgi:hypothetical protein
MNPFFAKLEARPSLFINTRARLLQRSLGGQYMMREPRNSTVQQDGRASASERRFADTRRPHRYMAKGEPGTTSCRARLRQDSTRRPSPEEGRSNEAQPKLFAFAPITVIVSENGLR